MAGLRRTLLSFFGFALLFAVATAFQNKALAIGKHGGRLWGKDKVLQSQAAADAVLQTQAASDANAQTKLCNKIIIAGAPASGKGTQCEMLKTQLGVVHLSTGDMLREAVSKGTEVGKKAKEFMESGRLVPDDVIIGIVKDRLAEDDCKTQGWLLDGFPRTRAQADALSKAGISADRFILLEVPDEMLIERVVGRRLDPVTGAIYHLIYFPPPQEAEVLNRLQHRADDTEEKARVRLDQYYANIDAIIGCYENILTRVDGTKAKQDVYKAIVQALSE